MAAAAPTTAATVSANNALFLVLFGMFLMVAVLPALLAALLRTLVLVLAISIVAAVTNPSDHSFAYWISSQENVRLEENPSVTQWFTAMYKTAMAMVFNEQLTWKFYNVIFFSVVFVPSIERYAIGGFGTWRWADTNKYLLALCRKPWVVKISRGGIHSSVERYLQQERSGAASPVPGSAGLRNRHSGMGSSPLLSGVASVFQAGDGVAETTLSDRDMRAKALHCKIRRDWKQANKFFLEAAELALTILSRTNYELEAAWCELEETDKYPDKKSELVGTIQRICEELSSAGYFDEAARAVADLALRLKRRFPLDCQKEEFAKELGLLYVQAKNIAEAGGSMHSAVDHGLRAASIYADAKLWSLAEECYETVGDIQRVDGHTDSANESYGNAVLCRIGQTDMVGAEQLMAKFSEAMEERSRPSDMDILLASLVKSYDKWSPQILEAACKRYDAARRLLPWQCQCIANLQDKMNSSDLR